MRRRTMVVVGAFVALVLAGCGGGSSAGPASAVPEGQTGTTVVDRTPFACPDPRTGASAGAGTLPPGATAALICYRDNGDLWFAPGGALTEGVGRLVRLVNAQDIHQNAPNENCNADLGPAFTIVLRFADGTRTITGENDGCRPVMVGSTERGGARRVFHAFLTALARQRLSTGPPDALQAAPSCPSDRIQPFSPLADPGHVVAASLCAVAGTSPVGPATAGPLTESQVAALRHDLATSKARIFQPIVGGHYCRSPILHGPVRVSGLDQWGDQFVVDLTCDTYRFVPRGGDSLVTVRLLPRTARMLVRG